MEVSPGGAQRRYLDTGDEGPAVLFLHGIPSHHVIWREVVAALPPEIRAIAPDLTGFGRPAASVAQAASVRPVALDLSPLGQARDMLGFLDVLGIERFAIVAHDYGGLVTCAMLELAPQRVSHLAITNTSLQHADWAGSPLSPFALLRPPLAGELAFSLARPFMLKWAYALYVAERHKLDGALMDELWEPFEHGFDRTLLRLFRERRATPGAFEGWRAALAGFDGPTLIAWGARDPAFRPDRAIDISRLLPQAERVVLAGSNHFIQIDRPRSLARLIHRLMARVS